MIKNYTYIAIAFLLMAATGFSQERQIKNANKKFEQFDYVDAREMYLRVADDGFASAEVFKKLGDSYYFTAEPQSAAQWYGKLISGNYENIETIYYLRYALALKSIKDYAGADDMMYTFQQKSGADSRGDMFAKERDYLKVIEQQSGRYDVESLSFNSENQDFGPAFYGSELLFSSNRKRAIRGQSLHEWNELPFLDLYVVEDPSTGTAIRQLDKGLNTKYHESTSVMTTDGNTIYFTRNNYIDSEEGMDQEDVIKLILLKTTKENNNWTKPVELPFNSNLYSVAHPALSPDGKTLYFASDMPGTKGLSDLWKVAITGDNTYGAPINLGDQINTEGRETFPFITSDAKLYFATDGHIGLGGLDVFVSELDSAGMAGESFNVGKPVNGSADDFGLILNEETDKGYFASNRSGGKGYDDIYGVVRNQKLITVCEQSVKGVLRDINTDAPLENATAILMAQDGEKVGSVTTDASGSYSFTGIACNTSYLIRGEKENYESAEATFATDNTLDNLIIKDLRLTPPVSINVGDDLAQTLNLNPIYFDFDKSFIRRDAALELTKILAVMEQFPVIKIDVRSHTDSRAPDSYNMALSERRNKSTIAWLVNKGVSSSRLTGRGYGESQLVNECSNGVSCSEEAHQLNRRSEFIILSK